MSEKQEVKVIEVELNEEHIKAMEGKIRFVRVKDNTLTVFAKEPTGMVVDPALRKFRDELKAGYKVAKDAFKNAASAHLKGTPMPQGVSDALTTARAKMDAIKGMRNLDDAKRAVAKVA